jgi:tryptophan synthase alpha chain
MTSYNPVLQFGGRDFAAASAAAGVDGVLVSDLPPHESDPWVAAARDNGLDTVFLVAPTSPEQRIKAACERSSGFVYCVSRTGVTGVREHLPVDLAPLVQRTRPFTSAPIGVGFGISKPEHVAAVTAIADAAIVGSAVVQMLADEAPWAQRAQRATDFVRALAEAKSGRAR